MDDDEGMKPTEQKDVRGSWMNHPEDNSLPLGNRPFSIEVPACTMSAVGAAYGQSAQRGACRDRGQVLIATTNHEKTPARGERGARGWRSVGAWRLRRDGIQHLESIMRRHQHQRPAVIPGDVDLMPFVLARSMTADANHGALLARWNRVGIVLHGNKADAVACVRYR